MPERDTGHRSISRELDDDGILIVTVKDTGAADPAADEALLDQYEAEADERRAHRPAGPAS